MEFTVQEYKEALNAAMLYAQAIVKDANDGRTGPSERSNKLLKNLGKHNGIIRDTAAELNNPPK